MSFGLHETDLTERTLGNLQFLIHLQLQKLSIMEDGHRETGQARAVLRQLMEMETAVRESQIGLDTPHAGAFKAA